MKDTLLQLHSQLFQGKQEMPFRCLSFVPDNGSRAVSVIIFAPNDIELSNVKNWLSNPNFEDDKLDANYGSIRGIISRFQHNIERTKVCPSITSFKEWIDDQKYLNNYSLCQVHILRLPDFPYEIHTIALAKTSHELENVSKQILDGKRNGDGLTRKELAIGRLVESWNW